MKNKLMEHFQEVVKIKTSSQSIATGFAVGTFISILPEPGFSVLLAVAIVLIFKKISKLAVFIAMAVWNPVTLIPLYWCSYSLGDILWASHPLISFKMTVLNRDYNFTDRFLLGNLIVAFVAAGICHGLVYLYWQSITKHKKGKKS